MNVCSRRDRSMSVEQIIVVSLEDLACGEHQYRKFRRLFDFGSYLQN
ncbi:hypothetical protein MIDIC_50054 [Alphaproteobacteria bacterium]